MSTTTNVTTPLVGVSGADNTFLVPSVDYTKVISEEKILVNHKQPNELFDRDILIRTGDINSTNSLTTNMLGLFDPFQLYLTNPVVVNALKPYQFVKFGLIVTMRMITPGACYGLYNLQALCEGGEDGDLLQDGVSFDAYPNSTQDVHGFLDLEARNNVVLDLPWEHYNNGIYLDGNLHVRSWRLLLWALSPIRSSISPSAAGTYQIFARMAKDREFVNLRYQQKKTSKHLSDFSHYASMAGSMMPSIAPYTMPAAAGLAALSSIADAMGFTRESAPKVPDVFITRQTTSLAPTDGQDRSEVVALTISNTLSLDPAIGGGDRMDPMAYSSLFDRWTIVDVFDVDNLSGGIIRTLPVTPYLSNTLPGFYPTNPIQYYPTTGGWVGAPFASWRGGMEYMVYIPSSSNLQGSLQVLWDPAPIPLAAYINDPTHVLSNVVIDLKGSSKTKLQVGYSRLEPVAESVFLKPDDIDQRANGHLRFRLMSPLQNPTLTEVTITVVVLARPMQDMNFGFPTSHYRYRSGASTFYPELASLRYQADKDDDASENTIVLAPSDPYPATDVHYGEEIKSVRALIQHFNTGKGFRVISDDDTTFYVTHFFPPPCSLREQNSYPSYATNSRLNPVFTYYSYFITAFVGVRGSMRYKIISNNGAVKVSGASVTIRTEAEFPFLEGDDSDVFSPIFGPGLAIMDLQSVTDTNGAEFTIPSQNYRKYHNVRSIFDIGSVGTSYYNRINAFRMQGTAEGNIFIAGGPDTTVTRFRRIPALLLGSDTI